MTFEEIDKLSDRELDKAVAKALGVEPEIIHIVTSDGGKSCCADTGRGSPWSSLHGPHGLKQWLNDQQSQGYNLGYELGEWKRYPKYSTDMRQAWEVVVAMRARGFSMWVGPGIPKVQGEWAVQIKPFTQNCHHFETADTVERAICRAALKQFSEGMPFGKIPRVKFVFDERSLMRVDHPGINVREDHPK
jgi:hypothetical protein